MRTPEGTTPVIQRRTQQYYSNIHTDNDSIEWMASVTFRRTKGKQRRNSKTHTTAIADIRDPR